MILKDRSGGQTGAVKLAGSLVQSVGGFSGDGKLTRLMDSDVTERVYRCNVRIAAGKGIDLIRSIVDNAAVFFYLLENGLSCTAGIQRFRFNLKLHFNNLRVNHLDVHGCADGKTRDGNSHYFHIGKHSGRCDGSFAGSRKSDHACLRVNLGGIRGRCVGDVCVLKRNRIPFGIRCG